MVILDIVRQFAHERCVHLFEPAQRIAAGLEHVLMPNLPSFQFCSLSGPLFAAHLDSFARQIKLLALQFQKLAQSVK